jgi:hypothetical protein
MENATISVMTRGKPKLEISPGFSENSTVTLRMKPTLDYSAVVRIQKELFEVIVCRY